MMILLRSMRLDRLRASLRLTRYSHILSMSEWKEYIKPSSLVFLVKFTVLGLMNPLSFALVVALLVYTTVALIALLFGGVEEEEVTVDGFDG